MKTSDQGEVLIREREGCVLRPYRDSQGVWTDGTGNTVGVIPNGPPITQAQADAQLKWNLARFEKAVNACVTVPLAQNQFDALVSFSFNCGEGALAHGNSGGPSSILRHLNAGDYEAAAAAFDNWHIPPEITERRNGEREQFKGTHFVATWSDK